MKRPQLNLKVTRPACRGCAPGKRLSFGDHPLRSLDRFAGRLDGFLFMSALDFVVLIGSMLGIAVYGIWRTRGNRGLNTYLKGDSKTAWFAIGLSVMATQASAITFLSTPGQGYLGGLGFRANLFRNAGCLDYYCRRFPADFSAA